MNQTTILIQTLFDVSINATSHDFNLIFDDMGPHLWSKFKNQEYNLLTLWGTLSVDMRSKLVDYINKHNHS